MSGCVFCEIAQGKAAADIVYQDEHSLAFVDLRQFHPGHMLVIPRQHLNDLREIDERVGAALMSTLARITRAVANAFPNDGISVWHSIGPAAFQEVAHLHFHVHPRRPDDQMLRVYPLEPVTADAELRTQYAMMLRRELDEQGPLVRK